MEKVESLLKFLYHHRAKLTAVVVTTAFVALMVRNERMRQEFMAEHNLTKEYNEWLSPTED